MRSAINATSNHTTIRYSTLNEISTHMRNASDIVDPFYGNVSFCNTIQPRDKSMK